MNICFYAALSGLANNGGTNTIVRTAAALRVRGHQVTIVSWIDEFDRLDHQTCAPTLRSLAQPPDVVCAVSYLDVRAMHAEWAGKKFWWMRLWNHNDNMAELAAMQSTIVNASWMQRRLWHAHEVRATCISQGTDIEFWVQPTGALRIIDSIGACRRIEPRKRHHDVRVLQEAAVMSRYSFSDADGKLPEQMREWYSTIYYFLAPADLEGLPNTPIEASLCGASLICRRNDEAGCGDFANEASALVYNDIREVPEMLARDTAAKREQRLVNIQRNIVECVGTREQCADALERVFTE